MFYKDYVKRILLNNRPTLLADMRSDYRCRRGRAVVRFLGRSSRTQCRQRLLTSATFFWSRVTKAWTSIYYLKVHGLGAKPRRWVPLQGYTRACVKAVDLGGPSVYQGGPKFESTLKSRCLQKIKFVNWEPKHADWGGLAPPWLRPWVTRFDAIPRV